jgi:hypothetical protein
VKGTNNNFFFGNISLMVPYVHHGNANVASEYRNCYFTLTYDSVRNT